MPCRALPRVHLCGSRMPAICDPPPFVFASVIILLSSISKLIVVKKGIHLTLTNQTKNPNKTPKTKPLFTSPYKIFTSPRRCGILWASGIQQQPIYPLDHNP